MRSAMRLMLSGGTALAMAVSLGCASKEEVHVYRDEEAVPVSYETRVDQQPRTVRETQVIRSAPAYGVENRWDNEGDGRWDDVEIEPGNREVEVKLEEKLHD